MTKTMDKRPIQLTEKDLHVLVENAVRVYLKENGMEEGIWGGLKTAMQGVGQGNFYLGRNYKLGKQVSSFSKYAQQIVGLATKMQQIADANNLTQISSNLVSYGNAINKMAQSFQAQLNQQLKPQQYNMQGADNYMNNMQNNNNNPMQYTQQQQFTQ